jgi:hypothetical protein
MAFLNTDVFAHRLAAETHLADGECLQVVVNRERFLTLR